MAGWKYDPEKYMQGLKDAGAYIKPAPGSQESHQSWINKNQGGLDSYVKTQQGRLNEAVANKDQGLIDRLSSDQKRVGYSLTDPRANISTETGQPAAPSGPNPSDLIGQIYDGQYNSRLDALRKARETALQGLHGVETQAKQGAYANRNSADAVSAQNAQRLREMMASQGLLASGDNITANANLGAARQGAIGDINQQEQNTLTDVSERRSMINNNSATDEQSLLAEVNAARANAMLGQMNADRGYGLDLAGLSGIMPGGGQTLASQQFGWGKQMDSAGLTGYFGNQRTLQGQNLDWQKSTDQRNFDYGKEQDKVKNDQWQKQYDWGKYESDRNYRYGVQQDAIKNGQWQQQFSLDTDKWGFQKASELWSQAFQQNQANQDDAHRKTQLEQSMSQAERSAAAQASDAILKSNLISAVYDPITKQQTSVQVANPDALNKYIKSLQLSDNATDSLLYQFGLDTYVKK